jgi:hypothetical protein
MNNIKKTAQEWYETDVTCDIVDADGWDRGDPNVASIWYNTLITFDEYQRRRYQCTVMKYNLNKHRPPFRK